MKDRIVVTGAYLPYLDNAPSLGRRPPLALGMVMAYARKMLGADPRFDVEPRFAMSTGDLESITGRPGKHVVLYSDYVWNYEQNMRASERIKSLRPDVINVHGGANIPGYPKSCEEFLRANRHVDYVVKGEGETALVDLLDALASNEAKKRPVSSISTLDDDDTFLHHPARDRTRDIDTFPSPYLSGTFDALEPHTWVSGTIETNRGCPYGCTFCDWGAATLQKIRTFDLERVRSEIQFLATHGVKGLWIADANFGILPRDVEVARIVADSKKKYGFPQRLTVQYAKNTHQHLVDIIQIFLDANLVSTGIISLQTRDDTTLSIVRRKNIRTREYDKLRNEFLRRGLPLSVQLMIGLPGATLRAMEDDLQFYFDTLMEIQQFRTVMLPNSPMAEPAYRETHRIVARDDGLITSTATMSEHDFHLATLVARQFFTIHHLGLIRYPLVFLQYAHGIRALDVMHALAEDEPMLRERFPLLAEIPCTKGYLFDLTAPHQAFLDRCRAENLWPRLHDELIEWVCERWGISRTAEWDLIAKTQEAVMPSAGRVFPCTVKLEHDVVRWYVDARAGEARALSSYPPVEIAVEDPLDVSTRQYSEHRATRLHFELASPLARVRLGDEAANFSRQNIALDHPGEVSLSWVVGDPSAPD